MLKPNGQELSFTVLVVLVSIAFILLLLPFHSAVLWAVILAVLFNPLQRRLTARFGGRRTRAAAVSLLVCICVVVIPVTLVFGALAQEASGLYERISTREFDPAALIQRAHERLPPYVLKLLEAADLGDRQFWWILTVAATAAGIALLVFGRTVPLSLLAVALIVLPHVVGAPLPDSFESPIPEALHHSFVVAVVVTSLVFWVLIGGLTGLLRDRFARSSAASFA